MTFPSDVDNALTFIQRGKSNGAQEMKARVVEAITRRIIGEQGGNSTANQYTADVLKALRAEVNRL